MRNFLTVSSAIFLACSLSACSSVGGKDVISSEPNKEIEIVSEKIELNSNVNSLEESKAVVLDYPTSNDRYDVKSITVESYLSTIKPEDSPEKVVEKTTVKFNNEGLADVEYVQNYKDIQSPTYTFKLVRMGENEDTQAMFEIITFKNKLNSFGMMEARDTFRDSMNVFFVLKEVKDKVAVFDLYINEKILLGVTKIEKDNIELNVPSTRNNIFFLTENNINLNDILVLKNNQVELDGTLSLNGKGNGSWRIKVTENVANK